MAGCDKEENVWISGLLNQRNHLEMLIDGGIILSQFDDEQKAALLSEPNADYFAGHGRVIKKVDTHQDSGYRRYRPVQTLH
jgi:hypothetical protein